MDKFSQNVQNKDEDNLDSVDTDTQRFMDARDYSGHSYDMRVETDSDLKNNIQNIQEFMDVEIRKDNA